ncbi:DUF86 domain-containing protein [Patescibacteria group bacterium]|nr:MAG: DUF86 domain-containing protein [Patescibacteria group bacterium]
MEKDPEIFLGHIQESIGEIEFYTAKMLMKDFLKDRKTQDAVIRRIEIVGEAVKNLPRDFKERYFEIPWREIAGMRDQLIHGYFGIDLNIVWKTVKKDIPKLKKEINELIESL